MAVVAEPVARDIAPPVACRVALDSRNFLGAMFMLPALPSWCCSWPIRSRSVFGSA